jgi:pimeloyl-ACP methyl ester carboxylesterase
MKSFVLLLLLGLSFGSAIGQARPESKWVKVDKTRVRYYDIGNPKAKNALVLVHCWTCNVEFWKESYSAFPEYRVIAMDLPGHGQSDKPKIDYSADFFAKAINAVLKKADVKKAVLVGHSMGTPIIRKFYERYPDKTLGLVIVDGGLIPYPDRAELDKFFEPIYRDYKNEAPRFIEGMLPYRAPQLAAFIRSSMLSTPEHVATSSLRLMADDAYAAHGKIDVPVLAIMAPSPYWPSDLEARYKALIPKLEFQLWADTGHFLQMERPAMFNSNVTDFVIRNKLL